jgi:hypothetical protein
MVRAGRMDAVNRWSAVFARRRAPRADEAKPQPDQATLGVFTDRSPPFGGLRVYLSDGAVELRPRSTSVGLLDDLRLPATSVSGCSMTCFGGNDRHADLLLGQQEAEVSFDAAAEIVDWCWRNNLPMLSGAQERGWLYEGRALPSKADYEPVARDEYERQANRTCMGY